jgi:hypothetical protein
MQIRRSHNVPRNNATRRPSQRGKAPAKDRWIPSSGDTPHTASPSYSSPSKGIWHQGEGVLAPAGAIAGLAAGALWAGKAGIVPGVMGGLALGLFIGALNKACYRA